MSVASVASYLNAQADKIYGIGSIIEVPLVRSGAPLASNAVFTFCPLTAPIPKGRWIIGGTVGVTVTDVGNDVITTMDLYLFKDSINLATTIYSAYGVGNAYTSNMPVPAIPFISDGTNTIGGQIGVQVSGSGPETWNVDAVGPECNITLIKISNEGYL